jgi:hypothetical protein
MLTNMTKLNCNSIGQFLHISQSAMRCDEPQWRLQATDFPDLETLVTGCQSLIQLNCIAEVMIQLHSFQTLNNQNLIDQ